VRGPRSDDAVERANTLGPCPLGSLASASHLVVVSDRITAEAEHELGPSAPHRDGELKEEREHEDAEHHGPPAARQQRPPQPVALGLRRREPGLHALDLGTMPLQIGLPPIERHVDVRRALDIELRAHRLEREVLVGQCPLQRLDPRAPRLDLVTRAHATRIPRVPSHARIERVENRARVRSLGSPGCEPGGLT
jgi:hypothetical protein